MVIINKCEICGKEIFTYPSVNKRLCSNKCRYEWQKGRKRISKKIGWNLPLIHNQRKGKTYEELYGEKKAKEIRDKQKESQNKVERKNENNTQWKGDNAGYYALHIWLRKNKPKLEYCEFCGKKEFLDIANISGEYSRNFDDYK